MVSVVLPLHHLHLPGQLGDLGIKFSYGVQLSHLLRAKVCKTLPIGFLLPLDLLYPRPYTAELGKRLHDLLLPVIHRYRSGAAGNLLIQPCHLLLACLSSIGHLLLRSQ